MGPWIRTVLIVVTALVVIAAGGAALALWLTRPPEAGAFYDPPDELPADAPPGTVLRSESFTRGVPEGARAWRVLYTSSDPGGDPIAVSGLVVAAETVPDGPRPVLAWAHGTSGVARGCAPSLAGDPLFGIPGLERILDSGWVIAATDYPGLGTPGPHPYLVGVSEGRSVLDSVRAARELDTGLDLDDRYLVWGHSQGGHAALFAGQEAAAYAPELELLGVGAIAPATELRILMEAAQGTVGGKVLTAEAVDAWPRIYPELSFEEAMVDRGERLARDVARRCITMPAAFVTLAEARLLPDPLLAIDLGSDPRWSRRLAENTPSDPIPAPVLVVQGLADQLIRPPITRAHVRRRCREGVAIELRERVGANHFSVIDAADEDLLGWTADRLAGAPVRNACAAP